MLINIVLCYLENGSLLSELCMWSEQIVRDGFLRISLFTLWNMIPDGQIHLTARVKSWLGWIHVESSRILFWINLSYTMAKKTKQSYKLTPSSLDCSYSSEKVRWRFLLRVVGLLFIHYLAVFSLSEQRVTRVSMFQVVLFPSKWAHIHVLSGDLS